jgi:hypothetical protein
VQQGLFVLWPGSSIEYIATGIFELYIRTAKRMTRNSLHEGRACSRELVNDIRVAKKLIVVSGSRTQHPRGGKYFSEDIC